MLSHLRAQHRAIEKGIKAIDTYLGRVSKGAKLDERGRCRLQYENVGLIVLVIPDHNIVIFKTFINFLPDPASGKLLPLYYHLLDMSDEPETGLAYFAIVAAEELGAEKDIISVETKRPIADISFEEFITCVRAVGEVANRWMERLEKEFEAPRVP
ncbi:MAG TPA: hypothetical protein ENI95_07370 [Chloroflexi bacterium]|nr:hypothetical protein [Chloroflexota bacterium]